MNRFVWVMSLALCFALNQGSYAQSEADKEKIREDRRQIRKSLSEMDRTEQSKVSTRLNLVVDEGISGLAEDAKPPKPGEMAPDFELTPLKFYEFHTRKPEITQENAQALYQPVRLSSFRGEKPVVLIFGSYT